MPHHPYLNLKILLLASCTLSLAALLAASAPAVHRPPQPQSIQSPASGSSRWSLTWSDEFNTPNNSTPDPAKWTYDLGGAGWGNQELETYTSRPQNSQIHNGNLVITARKEDFTGADGIPRNYTSARLKTQYRFSQAYGRFEARIKIPRGQGIWPAFWLLGDDIDRVDWPQCGEIDIMENIGREPTLNNGSLHASTFTGPTSDATKTIPLSDGRALADDFHIYAIEWEHDVVRFYLDDNNYATFLKSDWRPAGQWTFDHPFFILLNVAVGGAWPGSPDSTTQFPQEMLVDYVRVYSKK
ncbi:MAG TPA: glycoside hydrolase family 16 protein [Candidatus Acidoferrum sp.]|nr:glycoside hydrolase family 16 protein [Candidatus Acidoferrum sp.]